MSEVINCRQTMSAETCFNGLRIILVMESVDSWRHYE